MRPRLRRQSFAEPGADPLQAPGASSACSSAMVALAAAIETALHQNEPVTKIFCAASRNRSRPVTAASA